MAKMVIKEFTGENDFASCDGLDAVTVLSVQSSLSVDGGVYIAIGAGRNQAAHFDAKTAIKIARTILKALDTEEI